MNIILLSGGSGKRLWPLSMMLEVNNSLKYLKIMMAITNQWFKDVSFNKKNR